MALFSSVFLHFLNGELFGNLAEAEVLTDRWIRFYNTVRPHFSLERRVPQTVIPEEKGEEPKCGPNVVKVQGMLTVHNAHDRIKSGQKCCSMQRS